MRYEWRSISRAERRKLFVVFAGLLVAAIFTTWVIYSQAKMDLPLPQTLPTLEASR